MEKLLASYREAVEERLRELLRARDEATRPLFQTMQYHMGWLDDALQPTADVRGKRLRPIFCLLCCQAAGGDWRAALPAAAAIELIHNFSLIHDDIEDESQRRRGRPAVWSRWGLAQGLNAGDAMWTVAHLAAYQLMDEGHEPALVLCLARELDETCLALCRGQYLDLAFEERHQVSYKEYMHMITGKTASLLAASCAVGAMLAGADVAQVEAYGDFGRELGLTFQIIDDLLGIWGDTQVTGKSAASDLLAKKKTLPVVYTMQWEREQGRSCLTDLYAQPALSREDVQRALGCLAAADARAYTQAQAKQHEGRMLSRLAEVAADNEGYDTLEWLAKSLIDRQR